MHKGNKVQNRRNSMVGHDKKRTSIITMKATFHWKHSCIDTTQWYSNMLEVLS